MFLFGNKGRMPAPEDALPGRSQPLRTSDRHYVNGSSIAGPHPAGTEVATFALGCFWGVEKLFWETDGVISTSAGYAGGYTPNATYEEVCSGKTGHAEAVRVIFDPARVSYEQLLKLFWENHDPTQGMKQGNDRGTQYRSVIFTHSDAQRRMAEASRQMYQAELARAGYGEITTEIVDAGDYYLAEEYHQQYLAKVSNGEFTHRGANPYCPSHSTGVACPIGLGVNARGRVETLEQV